MGSTNENSFYGPVRNALTMKGYPVALRRQRRSGTGRHVYAQPGKRYRRHQAAGRFLRDHRAQTKLWQDLTVWVNRLCLFLRSDRYFGKYIDDIALALEIMGKPDE